MDYLNQIIDERYEMQEIIGVGGMAVVYKAYDRVDDRTVAVKILKDEYLANEEFRLRFKNESKVISMLSHPNIVKVFDVSFGETLQYIVMEHVEGITLKEYMERQGALDWKEALHFVVQILRALQHAHDKGIIHRDIKPQNILLLPNANIKVTDFGIARFNRPEKNINEYCAIGSVHYMSPEQARGEMTDARTDIYSVGVVLYEMLTGKLPFESEDDMAVAMMQVRDEAEKPSSINSSIPLGLEQITLRAMQKNPADRYQAAAEFLLDLDEFKRNPLIKFDYSYFIDKSPTKFISKIEETVPGTEETTEDGYSPEYDGTDEDGDDDEEEEEERNVTIPILIGVAIALVLVVAFIVAMAFAEPIKELLGIETSQSDSSDESFLEKLDVFGWFGNDKIEVPNFLNMTFDEVLEKYPDLMIENPPQYVYSSQYDEGHVCDQTPAAGDKVSKDTVMRLSVVATGQMILIKDVTGLDYVEAETVLRSLGLNVELVPAIDESKTENEVVYTLPSVNTYTTLNGTVYVYYATPGETVNSSKVPNVVGDQLTVARAKVKNAGLKVGAITYEASSEKMKDYVIGQNPPSYSTATSGTYVNLIVGNGVPESATATFSIYLPKTDDTSKHSLKTYLNNNAYDVISGIKLDGSIQQLSFNGEGKDNTFKVYVENSIIYIGNIDFTTDPPTVSNVGSYTYYSRENVPDVTGKNEEQARKALEDKGFRNVTVEHAFHESIAQGHVISQTPVYSSLTTYSTGTTVTIVISDGPEVITTVMPESTTSAENTTASGETTTAAEVTTLPEPTSAEENTTSAEHTTIAESTGAHEGTTAEETTKQEETTKPEETTKTHNEGEG